MSILAHADRTGVVLSFVSIVAISGQLIVIRGFDRGLLHLFVFLPLVAMCMSLNPVRSPGRSLARLFLVLNSVGFLVTSFPRVFPDLRGADPALPPDQSRAMAWYLFVYVIYGAWIGPVFFLRAELEKHRLQKPAQVSKFTCRFGIVTAMVVGPAMVLTVMSVVKVWPVFR